MELGLHVAVVPRHVDVFLNSDHGWSIQYKGDLAKRQSISNKVGRSLSKEWSVEFRQWPTMEPSRPLDEPPGVAEFLPDFNHPEHGHDEQFAATIFVDEGFDALLGSAMKGCLPRGIRITIKGIEFGSSYDGSAKIWDTENRARRLVTEWAMRLTESEDELRWRVENNPEPEERQPSPQESNREILAGLRAEAQSIRALIAWVLFAVMAVALLTLFR